MKKEKLYFKDEDEEICYSLSYHIANAKEEGLKEIELFEAIPDKELNKEYVWCSEFECTEDKCDCDKFCNDYLAPEKGRICQHRGKLMSLGNSVKFDVETSFKVS